MRRVVLLTSIAVFVMGCSTTHQSIELNNNVKKSNMIESKSNIEATQNVEPTNTTVAVKPICSSAPDTKRRVFHSMYPDQQAAEKAYTKITANLSTSPFFQLMAVARQESIDSDSRERGGDLGYIKFTSFDKSFATAVFHLPLKTLSHPIQSLFGWHLVWVSDALDIKTNQHCG